MYIFLTDSDAGVFNFTQGQLISQQLIGDIIMVKMQFCNIYPKQSKLFIYFQSFQLSKQPKGEKTMRTINVVFEDKEYDQLKKLKRALSWHGFMME